MLESETTVLLLGAGGQLGSCVRRLLPEESCFEKNRDVCDVTNFLAVDAAIRTLKPAVVINCAASSSARRLLCSERDRHFAVNAAATAHLAKACRLYGCDLIHISDGEIFGGGGRRRFGEYDCAQPLDVYAGSKLAGEHAILSVSQFADTAGGSRLNYWILRTSLLLGDETGLASFAGYLFKQLASSRSAVDLSSNVARSPLLAATLAEEIVWLVNNRGQVPCGVYHVSAVDSLTIFEMGELMSLHMGDACHASLRRYEPVEIFGCPVAANGSLDTRAWTTQTSRKLPNCRAEVARYVRQAVRRTTRAIPTIQ